jgi:hypothetical protein
VQGFAALPSLLSPSRRPVGKLPPFPSPFPLFLFAQLLQTTHTRFVAFRFALNGFDGFVDSLPFWIPRGETFVYAEEGDINNRTTRVDVIPTNGRDTMQENGMNTVQSPRHNDSPRESNGSLQSPSMAAQRGHSSGRRGFNTRTALLSVLATVPGVMAQSCISLSGSTQCPAFSSASISTDSSLIGFFPFLQYVSSIETFDQQLSAYVSTAYVQEKYQNLLGCSGISLTNTTEYYARYTTTVICNSVIQNSRTLCSLTTAQSQPVCADTCVSKSNAYPIRSICSL